MVEVWFNGSKRYNVKVERKSPNCNYLDAVAKKKLFIKKIFQQYYTHDIRIYLNDVLAMRCIDTHLTEIKEYHIKSKLIETLIQNYFNTTSEITAASDDKKFLLLNNYKYDELTNIEEIKIRGNDEHFKFHIEINYKMQKDSKEEQKLIMSDGNAMIKFIQKYHL